MPITPTLDGDNVTITATWTGLLTVVQRTVDDAAHYLFNMGRGDHGTEEEPRIFTDLSNQEKLDLVYNHITQVVKDMADDYVSNLAQAAARDAVIPHEL